MTYISVSKHEISCHKEMDIYKVSKAEIKDVLFRIFLTIILVFDISKSS